MKDIEGRKITEEQRTYLNRMWNDFSDWNYGRQGTEYDNPAEWFAFEQGENDEVLLFMAFVAGNNTRRHMP
jgi:hypothetical protein